MNSHRAVKWVALGVGVLLVLLFVLAIVVPYSSGHLRKRVVAALSDKLDSEVELKQLHASIFPSLHVDGTGLVVRHKGRRDVPPMFSVDSFSVDAGLLPLFFKHVSHVELTGLDIEIPPDHGKPAPENAKDEPATGGQGDHAGQGGPAAGGVVIDVLESHDAKLAILSDEPGKAPKVWKIHTMEMRNVGAETAMPFQAVLTNAVPPGQIDTSGTFGPWSSGSPGQTPLDGKFQFAHADLSVFNGISGILSAHGTFAGSLGQIDIHGETDTPKFAVSVGGHTVPLHAKYHTVVDAMNGNTYLRRIDASFLQTSLVATGEVVDTTPGKPGRTVRLDVDMQKARLEDVLRLAVDAPKPVMTGDLKLKTKFVLPPGEVDVVRKLQLDGQFSIDRAKFTDFDIQKKINELSHRGRGIKDAPKTSGVASDFDGKFKLGDALLRIPDVTFKVPGAGVRLAGSYGLTSEQLDFKGTLFLDVKVSQTTSGFKSLLLKVVDPIFDKKGGGSAIPIKISGKRSDPSFGLDKGRIFHH
jgi:hypothetical protein